MQNGIGYQLNRVMWKTIKKTFGSLARGSVKEVILTCPVVNTVCFIKPYRYLVYKCTGSR